jgi:enamine deaminase RidA (YjgF/YER057c/UK114 family)
VWGVVDCHNATAHLISNHAQKCPKLRRIRRRRTNNALFCFETKWKRASLWCKQLGRTAVIQLSPTTIAPPFARYAHGVIAEASGKIIALSGQLGLAPDKTVPESAEAQARICLDNIDAILAEAGASRRDILRLNAYVTDRAHLAAYMAARDAWLVDMHTLPASTLMIVAGFAKPEFVVEVEVLAMLPNTR